MHHYYYYMLALLNKYILCIYYRGPKGVWTLEKEGKKPEISLDFNDAKPTVTHMAIKTLVQNGLILEYCFLVIVNNKNDK